jgi:DNA-binding NarL/FixJ family response regulator
MDMPFEKEREMKVVELRKEGKTIRKIAEELEISSRGEERRGCKHPK